MTVAQRWQPPHFRRGCWVESYKRRDGRMVKRHWRNGHHVSGHFATLDEPGSGKRDTTPRRRRRRTPVAVAPSSNNVAVAIAIENAGFGKVVTGGSENKRTVSATLGAVRWFKDGEGKRIDGLTAGVGMANLPCEVDTIILDIILQKPDGSLETIRAPAPCFANADGSMSFASGPPINTETVNRALSMIKGPTDLTSRNRIRQRLGRSNPERAMQDALADAFREILLPDLPITQKVSMALPDSSYTITLERIAGPTKTET